MESLARWTRYFSVSQSVNGVSGLVIIPKGRHEAGRKDRRSFSTEEFKEDRAETTTTTRRRRAREKTYLHLHWRAQIVGKKRESNKGGEQVPGGGGGELYHAVKSIFIPAFFPPFLEFIPRYNGIIRILYYRIFEYRIKLGESWFRVFFFFATHGKTIKTPIVLSFFGNFV